MPDTPDLTVRGVAIHKGYLDTVAQTQLVDDVRGVVERAPLFSPETRFGKAMSVRMTSAGRYGWYSDRRGYRYEKTHPSGVPWPPIPQSVLRVWHFVSGVDRAPDCCLVNFYDENAKMGMHQDRDEADFSYPVVSISLGDAARFRIGNLERGGKTDAVWLDSGDVAVLGGEARLLHHGIDKLRPASSTLLPKGGRLNLTLRVVD